MGKVSLGITFKSYKKLGVANFDDFATSPEGLAYFEDELSYLSEGSALSEVFLLVTGVNPLPNFRRGRCLTS